MTINRQVRIGLLLLLLFVLFEVVTGHYFEIRSTKLNAITKYFELLSFLTASIILILGLRKQSYWWKWYVILPLGLFCVIYFSGEVLWRMSDDLTIREDTEVLFISSRNAKRKIIRQDYWTGIASSNYNSDTIIVYEFSPWVRFRRPVDISQIDKSWVRAAK